jgi:hypothetical protein
MRGIGGRYVIRVAITGDKVVGDCDEDEANTSVVAGTGAEC